MFIEQSFLAHYKTEAQKSVSYCNQKKLNTQKKNLKFKRTEPIKNILSTKNSARFGLHSVQKYSIE